jgi:ketosteroid isomerase-like protein
VRPRCALRAWHGTRRTTPAKSPHWSSSTRTPRSPCPTTGPALAGRTAIADDFRALFHDYRGEHHTEVLALEVTGDWAIERGRYTLATTPRDGGTIVSEEGKHVVVRHRVDGAWKIHWEIWNTDQPRTP